MALESATVVVPVFRPELVSLSALLETAAHATLVGRVLIVDSSGDVSREVPELCQNYGADWVELPFPFDHGGARNFGAAQARRHGSQVVVYMTQDCLPVDGSAVDELIRPLVAWDTEVAATTGRQVPRPDARPLERSSRAVMYPPDEGGRHRLGLFGTSNSFAAYSIDALEQVGGFPAPCAFGEDAIVSERLRSVGFRVEYVPSARAMHSHNHSLKDEFRRFFDAGQAASGRPAAIGYVENADRRAIVCAEIRHVWGASRFAVVRYLLTLYAKAIGYHIGKIGERVPNRILPLLSASPHVLNAVREAETAFILRGDSSLDP